MAADPILYTPADLADLASYFAARGVVASDAARHTADPLEQRDYEASARTWALAAAIVNQAVKPAPLIAEEMARPLRVVAGTDFERERSS